MARLCAGRGKDALEIRRELLLIGSVVDRIVNVYGLARVRLVPPSQRSAAYTPSSASVPLVPAWLCVSRCCNSLFYLPIVFQRWR